MALIEGYDEGASAADLDLTIGEVRALLNVADAAWRARAEAAIAWAEEGRKLKELWGTGRVGGDYLRQVDTVKAARRRYEETCRAG